MVNMSPCHDMVNMSPCHDMVNMSSCHDMVNMSSCHDMVNISPCHDKFSALCMILSPNPNNWFKSRQGLCAPSQQSKINILRYYKTLFV